MLPEATVHCNGQMRAMILKGVLMAYSCVEARHIKCTFEGLTKEICGAR